MFGNEPLLNFLQMANIFVIVFMVFALMLKIDRIKQMRAEASQLKRSLEEMDEQAKLIVRTDMELNKAQEELDKKISGLYALQRLSRTISTTLEESQIFKKIETDSIEDLGFEKACGLLWNEKENKFALHLNIGYSNDEIETIKSSVNIERNFLVGLINKEKTFSSISADLEDNLRRKINQVFKTNSFIISPILPKEGNKGLLLVGTDNTDVSITEGDEELITVLANQIGQVLENARLFENTWRSQQDLEKKVEERTHALSFALDQVQKINRRKTDFVSSVSHELRTPLTSIKGYAAILLAEKLGTLPPPVKERIEKINRHSDELTHLVNDMLDISRIESGRMTMQRISCKIKAVLDKAVDLLSVQAKEKQIELYVKIPDNTPDVFIDQGQIERIFINIVGNALKFTPAQGKITIAAAKIDKFVQMDISDTGCGIPEDAQELIFEEFYRVDNLINQQVKGTGLGLALVKHIIQAHNGKIWIKSKPGSGSTFSFTLPVAT